MVEHRLYTPAVTGSNPVPPTINLQITLDEVEKFTFLIRFAQIIDSLGS